MPLWGLDTKILRILIPQDGHTALILVGDVRGVDFVSIVFLAVVGVTFVELGLCNGPEADTVRLEVSSRLVNVAVASVSDV